MLRLSELVKWVVMWSYCLISKEGVALSIKGIHIGKEAVPISVVSEIMKAFGDLGTRRMADLINNIIKEGGIPDDWRKGTRGKVNLCVRFIQSYQVPGAAHEDA